MKTMNKMSVTERVVSVKKHTIGYVINGEEYTRNQAVKLARSGKVRNVRVVSASSGSYLQGDGLSLSTLPSRTSKSSRFSALRSR